MDRGETLRRTAWVAAFAAALGTSAACGGEQPSGSAVTTGTSTQASTSGPTEPASAEKVMVARGFDKNGNPTGVATQFDHATDKRVLIVVPTAGASVGTKYAYTRYLEGKYVDSRTANLEKPGRYLYFETQVKPGQTLVPGHFRYQIYTDRTLTGAVEFDVK